MLYFEITSAYQFERLMPESRTKNYSYYGLKAMYEYWDRKAETEDISIGEELDYPCCEYDSVADAVNNYGDIDDIHREMVEEYLWWRDIDINDVDDWEQYIKELDEDDINQKCIEFLEECNEIEYVEELDNGHVFLVRYDC